MSQESQDTPLPIFPREIKEEHVYNNAAYELDNNEVPSASSTGRRPVSQYPTVSPDLPPKSPVQPVQAVQNGYNNPPPYFPQPSNQPNQYPPAPLSMVTPQPYQQPYFTPLGQQQHQQQSSTVVVGGASPVIVQQPRRYQSFVCPIILACFTFCFCGIIFGLIAFILAMIGQSAASKGRDKSARDLLHASYGVSIVGIVVGVIIIVVVASVLGSLAAKSSSFNCNNQYIGCNYGYYYDNINTCKQCCSSYDNNMCSLYGSYNDYHGCKGCCNTYNNNSCQLYGSYLDSNRCKQCCNNRLCLFGYSSSKTDASGCKLCCIGCPYGFSKKFDSDGCQTCCNQCPYGAGNTTDSSGCNTCCGLSGYCPSGGYYINGQGCRQCCIYVYNNVCYI